MPGAEAVHHIRSVTTAPRISSRVCLSISRACRSSWPRDESCSWSSLREVFRHFRVDGIDICQPTESLFKGESERLRTQWQARHQLFFPVWPSRRIASVMKSSMRIAAIAQKEPEVLEHPASTRAARMTVAFGTADRGRRSKVAGKAHVSDIDISAERCGPCTFPQLRQYPQGLVRNWFGFTAVGKPAEDYSDHFRSFWRRRSRRSQFASIVDYGPSWY